MFLLLPIQIALTAWTALGQTGPVVALEGDQPDLAGVAVSWPCDTDLIRIDADLDDGNLCTSLRTAVLLGIAVAPADEGWVVAERIKWSPVDDRLKAGRTIPAALAKEPTETRFEEVASGFAARKIDPFWPEPILNAPPSPTKPWRIRDIRRSQPPAVAMPEGAWPRLAQPAQEGAAYVTFTEPAEETPVFAAFDAALPVLRLDWHHDDHGPATAQNIKQSAMSFSDRMGSNITSDTDRPPDETIRNGGTAAREPSSYRMGASSSFSVCDTFVWLLDSDDVYPEGASVFASNPDKNPTVTVMALPWRGADHLTEATRRHEL